jgi:hypothetical protein
MDINFQTQMEFVRERNRIKYENKIMSDEDKYSQIIQSLFQHERELELQKRIKEQEKLMIQEQIKREEQELLLFVENYMMNKIQRLSQSHGYYNINFDELRIEAENIFYDRLLKRQQDEEYNRTIINDMRNHS